MKQIEEYTKGIGKALVGAFALFALVGLAMFLIGIVALSGEMAIFGGAAFGICYLFFKLFQPTFYPIHPKGPEPYDPFSTDGMD